MNKAEHIPTLDGLRGLAVTLVVFSHFDRVGFAEQAPVLFGAGGVMLFFVLSGFLMGHLYLRKSFDLAALTHYTAARIGRIFPLFYLVILGSFLASIIVGEQYINHLDGLETLKHLGMVGSRGVFWSIPPEVEFYVVFTFLWWAICKGLASIFLVPLVLLFAFIILFRPIFPGITVFSHLHIFVFGMLAGICRPHLSNNRAVITSVQIFSLLGLALVVSGVPSRQFVNAIGWQTNAVVYGSLPVAIIFSCVTVAFSFVTAVSRFALGNRFMRLLGKYSFSIYLLHEPIMAGMRSVTAGLGLPLWLQVALALAVTFAVGAASFRFYERPMQKLVRGGVANVARRFVEPKWSADARRLLSDAAGHRI